MPRPMWEPPAELVEGSVMKRYMRWLDKGFEDYDALWRWSVEDLDGFWASIWEYFGVRGAYDRVLGAREMPGAQWFEGAEVNYAEHLLGHSSGDALAIVHASELREQAEWTRGDLRAHVARIAAGLRALG